MPTDMTPEEEEEAKMYADILTTLAERIRTGETKVTSHRIVNPGQKWWTPGNWEFFRLEDMTMTLTYHNPEHRKKELERLEAYKKANPRALHEDAPWPVIALNDIPRGAHHDYNLEEGWVQYRVPKSGNHEDYSVADAPMELRRYYGKVTIVGYNDPAVPFEDSPLKQVYESIPVDKWTPLPTEAYEVIPEEPPKLFQVTKDGVLQPL